MFTFSYLCLERFIQNLLVKKNNDMKDGNVEALKMLMLLCVCVCEQKRINNLFFHFSLIY